MTVHVFYWEKEHLFHMSYYITIITNVECIREAFIKKNHFLIDIRQ